MGLLNIIINFVDAAEARSDQAAIRHEIAEMGREIDDLITEFQTQSMEIFKLEIDDYVIKSQPIMRPIKMMFDLLSII